MCLLSGPAHSWTLQLIRFRGSQLFRLVALPQRCCSSQGRCRQAGTTTSACIATLRNCCILSVLAVARCSCCPTCHQTSLHDAAWQETKLQEYSVLAAVMGFGDSQLMGVCNTSRQPCLADGFPEVTSPQHASTQYTILPEHMLPMNTLNSLTHLPCTVGGDDGPCLVIACQVFCCMSACEASMQMGCRWC